MQFAESNLFGESTAILDKEFSQEFCSAMQIAEDILNSNQSDDFLELIREHKSLQKPMLLTN